MSYRRNCASVSIATSVLISIAACGATGSPDQAEPSTPDTVDNSWKVNYIWSSTQALNITSPEGTFVRAVMESRDVNIFLEARDAQYPGFLNAMSESTSEYFPDRHGPDSPYADYSGARILSAIARLPQPNGAKYVLCSVSRIQNAKWPPADISTSLTTIDVTTTGSPPPANQVGPARRPTSNVFGGWKVTSMTFQRLSEPPKSSQNCSPAYYEQHKNDPASPGWPSATPATSSTERQ